MYWSNLWHLIVDVISPSLDSIIGLLAPQHLWTCWGSRGPDSGGMMVLVTSWLATVGDGATAQCKIQLWGLGFHLADAAWQLQHSSASLASLFPSSRWSWCREHVRCTHLQDSFARLASHLFDIMGLKCGLCSYASGNWTSWRSISSRSCILVFSSMELM